MARQRPTRQGSEHDDDEDEVGELLGSWQEAPDTSQVTPPSAQSVPPPKRKRKSGTRPRKRPRRDEDEDDAQLTTSSRNTWPDSASLSELSTSDIEHAFRDHVERVARGRRPQSRREGVEEVNTATQESQPSSPHRSSDTDSQAPSSSPRSNRSSSVASSISFAGDDDDDSAGEEIIESNPASTDPLTLAALTQTMADRMAALFEELQHDRRGAKRPLGRQDVMRAIARLHRGKGRAGEEVLEKVRSRVGAGERRMRRGGDGGGDEEV